MTNPPREIRGAGRTPPGRHASAGARPKLSPFGWQYPGGACAQSPTGSGSYSIWNQNMETSGADLGSMRGASISGSRFRGMG